jgi:hypothetical protein
MYYIMLSAEQLAYLKKFETNSEFSKNINRPLSMLFETIGMYDGRPNIKIGLALCHGHNHSNDNFIRLKFVNYWYYVDLDEIAFPDYICDVTNLRQLEYFPDKIFDYIFNTGCPDIFNTFDKCKRLLKPTGYIISLNHSGWIGWYLDDGTLGKINEKLIDNNPNVIKCLNDNYGRKFYWYDHLTENQNKWRVLSSLCYPIKTELIKPEGKKYSKKILIEPEIIKQIIKKYSKKILKDHDYQYIKYFGPYLSKHLIISYLFIKPIIPEKI